MISTLLRKKLAKDVFEKEILSHLKLWEKNYRQLGQLGEPCFWVRSSRTRMFALQKVAEGFSSCLSQLQELLEGYE